MTETVNMNIYPSLNGRPVKLFVKDEIRRFSFNGSSLHELRSVLKQLLSISHDAFVVRYQDDEGDHVTITSDAELNYAWQLMGTQALRLSLEEKNANASTQPTNPPVSPPASPSARPKEMWKEARREFKVAKREAKMEKKAEKFEHKVFKKEAKFAKKVDKNGGGRPFAARFVKHVTVEDNYEFAAGTAFTKIWRFRNEGTVAWPDNSIILFVGKKGDQMGAPNFVALSKTVLPGEEIDVSVPMIAPTAPGSYFGYWRLADLEGRKFGQRVRVLIKVAGDSTSSDESPSQTSSSWGEMLTQLESMGFTDKATNVKLITKTRGDMDKIVAKLLKREQKKSGRVHKH
jgi:hypothetical protein